MKEQIYTIPINEAYETDCECALCLLEKKCEQEAVEYALGAAMMEPDYRILSNEKGYCKKHFRMQFEKPNKLSLALVLETHLAESISVLERFYKSADSLKGNKKSIFKKNNSKELATGIATMLKKREDSCVICDKINYTMNRYIRVFLDMWRTEPEFRKKVEDSKGVCLPHMRMLLEASDKMPEKDRAEFVEFLYQKQKTELERIKDDIHHFTLKFDYRNKDMEWGAAEDAPLRTIEKIAGIIGAD